ncbi:MAG TPA: histidine phosphatase family protein [Nocardioidaceae bacterium]|nr:histidine phosphatase family protein [Nocardioidaceae bacterium]
MTPTGQEPGSGEVWLARHGETEWSRAGRHTGVTDRPLTETGEQRARALAGRLSRVRFDLVLTSPRQRARRTAALAGFPDAQVDPDLAEWAYGDYEGQTSEQIHETWPGWTIFADGAPGGETPDEMTQRVDRVVAACREHGGRMLLFGHGHCLRALATRWIGQPVLLGAHLPLETGRLSVLGYDRGIPTIDTWNT